LRKRRTEDETTFARRVARVPMELALGKAFDVQVVNDDLDRAINEVQEYVSHHIHQS
jgi:guanylate kinase